jgi:hypothetical protein
LLPGLIQDAPIIYLTLDRYRVLLAPPPVKDYLTLGRLGAEPDGNEQ